MKHNYTYRYNRIIHYFQITRPITKETCPSSELHHIVPRSLGGTNDKSNIVLLPIHWHYIVHCWLPAVYLEQGNHEGYEKMLFAWNRMQNYKRGHREALETIKKDSRLYEKLKTQYVTIAGKFTSRCGDKNSQFGKHWYKDPNDKTKSMPIKEGDPVPEGWVKGRWFCGDRMKCSVSMKGKMIFFDPDTNQLRAFRPDEKVPDGWIHGLPPNHIPKDTLKRMSNKAKNQRRRELVGHQDEMISLLSPMYDIYLKEGFEAVKLKFNYPYSRVNFLQLSRHYLPDKYIDGRRRRT